MAHWNYRIILHDRAPEGDRYYGLHKVHYEGDRIVSWAENATSFTCDHDEAAQGVIQLLEMALADVRSRPVLIESEISATPA
jgi:hypothetical protein